MQGSTPSAISGPAAGDAADVRVPLCVDLDGTFLKTDVLVEGLLRLLKRSPLYLFAAVLWLLRGRANLKAEISRRTDLRVDLLPINQELLAHLKTESARGRRIILCTAANDVIAKRVAEHYGIFAETLASDSSINLSGKTKGAALAQRYGEQGFDYAGNESKDIHVWKLARQAIVVSPTQQLRRQLKTIPRLGTVLPSQAAQWRQWFRAFRMHQWAKNLLVFVPAMAAHRLWEPQTFLLAVMAFIWFGVCASATYLVNDLLDLDADRAHVRKSSRPFAAGNLSLIHGMLVASLGIVVALVGSYFTLGPVFAGVLLLYLVGTLWYSSVLKRIAMVDVLTLAALYTVRLLAGSAAVGVLPSFWLLAFSIFMFLSLAIVKRYTELTALLSRDASSAPGRGYVTDDIPLLLACGPSAGLMSVLVMALYIDGGTAGLYRRPEALWLICPLMLYWVLRVWRKAHRGELHDDPVVFALRDTPSLAVGALCAALLWVAA